MSCANPRQSFKEPHPLFDRQGFLCHAVPGAKSVSPAPIRFCSCMSIRPTSSPRYLIPRQKGSGDGINLIVHRNEEAFAEGANTFRLGLDRCCQLLKTQALKDALRTRHRCRRWRSEAGGGAIAGRGAIFSIRDGHGQWEPKRQRTEVWNLYNCRRTRTRRCACSRCRTGRSCTCGSISAASGFPWSISTLHGRAHGTAPRQAPPLPRPAARARREGRTDREPDEIDRLHLLLGRDPLGGGDSR